MRGVFNAIAFVHLPVQENSQSFVVAQKHVISSIVSRKIPTVISQTQELDT